MITINLDRSLDENELSFEYFKASGPGGQNINKVSSAVRLRFNIQKTSLLDNQEKERLSNLAGAHLTDGGDLIIEARRYRSQERNRLDAINKLISLISSALTIQKSRIKTYPGKSSRSIRLEHKKKRGQLKNNRKNIPDDWN